MSSLNQDLSKYTPAYEPVSLREPNEAEKRIDATLKAYMDVEMKLESDEEMTKRDVVLAEVRNIFLKWIHRVAVEILHMPEDEAEEAGGELFISGSHRLGVRDIGADIDTVCVTPNFCTREHFFTYLKEAFENHPEVTELNAVEGALVPIISFDFRGVSIDLLFARLAENNVPKDVDILDDRILKGLDDATEKSLNGPRVTNMIFKLVGEKTFPNFLIVLRCIRKWAKRRGLYGNKLGYLGGINCNILVAFICQLYPNSSPSSLLFRFFKQYKDWKWPEPIMLNNIQQNPLDAPLSEQRDIWSSQMNPQHIMPIITPAYPAMNSSYSVNKHTFEVMRQEIKRGYDILETILKERGSNWERLFAPSDFFIKYPHYLACHVVGTDPLSSDSRGWVGFVESRIRNVVKYPFLETLPLKHPIQLYPVVSKTARSPHSICYFIGFHLDVELLAQMHDKNIRIDDVMAKFRDGLFDPERGFKGNHLEGLDFYVDHMTWKKLPPEVFEATYGGKEEAKARRIELGYATASSSAKKRKRAEETEGAEGENAESTTGAEETGDKMEGDGDASVKDSTDVVVKSELEVELKQENTAPFLVQPNNLKVVVPVQDISSLQPEKSSTVTAEDTTPSTTSSLTYEKITRKKYAAYHRFVLLPDETYKRPKWSELPKLLAPPLTSQQREKNKKNSDGFDRYAVPTATWILIDKN